MPASKTFGILVCAASRSSSSGVEQAEDMFAAAACMAWQNPRCVAKQQLDDGCPATNSELWLSLCRQSFGQTKAQL